MELLSQIQMLFLACPACAEAFKEAGGDAAGWAILVMLLLIVPILGSIGFFFVRFVRREALQLDPSLRDEWS